MAMTSVSIPLVTSWDTPCGIAEHSRMLRDAVRQADADIQLVPMPTWLDPHQALADLQDLQQNGPDDSRPSGLIHLNHHDALHARWTVDHVKTLQQQGYRVLVTWHDTREGTETSPSSARCLEWASQADVLIVHERAADLAANARVRVWPMGVLPAGIPSPRTPLPTVGSVGFAFPWKGFELLCDAAREAGWGVRLIAHDATDEQVQDWRSRHVDAAIWRRFMSAEEIVRRLAECTATAFLYQCANTGQSAAILHGIAARRPLLATRGCRQFRAIEEAERDLGITAITWVEPTVKAVAAGLASVAETYTLHYLAEHLSWTRVGQRHAQLYRELLGCAIET